MTWLYSPTFLPYTVVAATSQLTGYEAAKIAVLDNHPYVRSWRSNNSLVVQSLLLDVGAPIVDPGFELNNLATGWSSVVGTAGAGDTATADATQHAHGSFSMKIVCNSGNDFGRQQFVSVVPGIQYTLRASLRVTARAAGTITCDVYYLPTGPQTAGINLTATNGSFTIVTDLATIPDGCTQVAVRCFGRNTPNFTAYFDDIALVPKIGAIGLFNTNSPTWTIGVDNDGIGSSFTFLPTVTMTKWWYYYRACLVQTVPLDREYVAMLTASTLRTTNAAAYYELGSVWFAPPLLSFPRAPAKDMTERLMREYEKSGESVSPAGPWRVSQEWKMVALASQIQGVKDFTMLGQQTPFLVYESNGNQAECGIYRYTDHIEMTRAGINRHVIINPRVIELV